jgi:hypothetical protein
VVTSKRIENITAIVNQGVVSRIAVGADGKRIIDIRVTENYGEVAKYVTKPGGYLELTGEHWQCDDRVLETLHYGLASRRMIAWSRSLSRIRKELGFLGCGGAKRGFD